MVLCSAFMRPSEMMKHDKLDYFRIQNYLHLEKPTDRFLLEIFMPKKHPRSSVYIIFRNKFSSSTCPSKVSVWAEKLVQRFLAHIQSNVWIKCHNSAINWMKCNEKDELIEKIWAKNMDARDIWWMMSSLKKQSFYLTEKSQKLHYFYK